MDEIVVSEVTGFYLGRGIQGEPFDDDTIELSINLDTLGQELDEALAAFEVYRGRVWMPLVDSDGTCVLDSTGLIPTLIPLV